MSLSSGEGLPRWAYAATEDDDRAAAQLGLRKVRELFQMRRPLPVEASLAGAAPPLAARAFVVGKDEDAWLRVNNRSFAGHPDQSSWTRADVEGSEAEPWFDPDGFLLHETDDGTLTGFCWTKVHDTDPPMGEIYVIGVDPDWHGRGLGRALVLAGLDHLARHGLRVGMLYVESTNAPAVHLYERLGFTVHHADRAYDR
jgi:mycothiol synthase